MPLLGQAAMLLTFDVAADAIAEHDDWHTHEHLPERLGIPGFLRGTRWVAEQGQPRYVVLYEVAALATLESAAYLARLNAPSPWTTKIMTHYRGMTRGFCAVTASFGLGAGQAGWLLRLRPEAGAAERLRGWLVGELLPALPQRAGLVGAHLLEGARTPPMTNEQRLRGADAGVDWAVFVTGYDTDALAALAQADLAPERLAARGAADVSQAGYRAAVTLTADERARAGA
jgi:hypothetical protein